MMVGINREVMIVGLKNAKIMIGSVNV